MKVIHIIDVWIAGVPAFNEAPYFVELSLRRGAATRSGCSASRVDP